MDSLLPHPHIFTGSNGEPRATSERRKETCDGSGKAWGRTGKIGLEIRAQDDRIRTRRVSSEGQLRALGHRLQMPVA